MDKINTHGLMVSFGKHKGELWTRVPVSYLTWLANQTAESEGVNIARAELLRRGTTYPEIEVSGHAVDRASLHCREIWKNNRVGDEGLHSWLIRIATEALKSGDKKGEDTYYYLGMKLVFATGAFYPTLKTIIRK